MKNCFWLLGFVLFFSQSAELRAQEKVELKGVVRDAQTKETLPGANVLVVGRTGSGVVTDLEGRFQLDVSTLPVTIQVSFIGFETLNWRVSSSEEAANLILELGSDEVALEEVVISGRAPDTNVRSMDIGRSQVPISTIKNIPALFGEVDVLRSLQLLPGVTNAGEGTTGLFVRGGSADQNLLQLDGAPVYNPSHFFGFFSVFNPDALDQIDFFKGNIPATFGGRASSVIDIGLKEGNFERIQGEGGLGIISSKLTVDGPLFGENSSFIVSARRTYADVFLRFANDPNVRNNQLYFYDLSGKLTFRLGDRDKLTVSAYGGRDLLGFNEQFRLGWQNQLLSAKWTRSIRSDFFFELNAYQSYYDYEVAFTDPDIGFDWTNRLGETGLRAAWTYLPDSRSQLDWGFHTQYYNFAPIDLRPAPGAIIEPIETNPNLGIQQNFFLQGSRELTERFSVEGGLRWSLYGRVGPGVQFLYENDLPNPELPPIDTLQFGALDLMKFYQGFEPRVGMRYLLGPSTSLKIAYNRNFQYVQVAANSSAGLPIDRWVPAGPYIEPVRADQIAAGVFQNLADNKWELSVEGFYKDFRNIIDLRQGANVLFNDAIETEILTGNGYAYGVEFLLRKNVGKTNGWLSYTYSRTWRVIDGISLGQRFNPRFDRPHDLALVLNHTFNERWSGNVNFIYTTGQAVTFPIGAYIVDNQRVPLFSDLRNEDRFPDYHRLDFSLSYKVPDRGRKWRSSWNFSMYNAYGRRNPFSYQFTEIINDDLNFAGSPEEIETRRPAIVMTYLFTFLPALSYNFEF